MKSLSLFSVVMLFAASVSAGYITCIDGSLNGGVGDIPIHNIQFKIFSTDTRNTCDAQNEECGQSASDAASFKKQVVKCIGDNNKTTKVMVWVDLKDNIYWWNVQAPGGKKYYCKGGEHGCTYSGCNRSTGFCS